MNFFDFIFEKRNFFLIISLILNGLLISVSGYLLYNNINYECEECNYDEIVTMNEVKEENDFYIEVKGAVKKPGVYLVNSNNIVDDVIKLAEGFTKKAYTKNINLSKKVSNELVIYVYTESEYKKLNEKEQVIIKEECVCPSYEITDCTNSGNSLVVPDNNITNDNDIAIDIKDKEENNSSTNSLININTASLEELMSLSGIGESKAKAIITYREQTKFNSIDEIKNVSGIGEAAFEKIKDNITV